MSDFSPRERRPLGWRRWIRIALTVLGTASLAPAQVDAGGGAMEVGEMPVSRVGVRLSQLGIKVISRQPEHHHVCPFGRIELMVSKDGAETWSWPRTIMDSLTDDRDSGVVETSRGVLLAKTLGANLEATLARWRAAESRATQEERRADVGDWLMRSTEGGRTWMARTQAPGYGPHGPIALRDGRVFYAAADGKKAAAWVSTDDGGTWQHLADLPTRAGELHSVEAADGTVIVHVRDKVPTAKGTAQRTLRTESRDGGRAWTAARFVAHGYPSHLLRMKAGMLLCTYGSRTPPLGIRLKVSFDHGRSWSKERVLTDDASNWDLGYPGAAQLAEGSLVTVWYEAPANSHRAVLRQAKWRLALDTGHRGSRS